MKAFIIYINNANSNKYATTCLESFNKYNNWEPELFEGLTPATLKAFTKTFDPKHKKNSRVQEIYRDDRNKYWFKKACSLNHYRLFTQCVKLNEPIAVIEHDSFCISDWDPTIRWDDILILNSQAAIDRQVLKPLWDRKGKPSLPYGIHDINIKSFIYKHNNEWKGAGLMPGTAAYAVTPGGAKKMIDVYEKHGWEQSDFIMNTYNVNIKTMLPELFTFKLPNLRMSHGERI